MKINMDYFELIQNTIDFIEDNLQNKITLESLSKIARYSPSQIIFTRYFMF